MANLSKAFSVLSRACDRLARMGVTDVHQRITARILPPEKCGAEDRALELAQEAIGELHARGLEAEARALSLQLEVEPLASARLAGSTVVDDGFLSPPPIARAMGAAVLRAADALFPPVPDQAHVTPASPLTPEDLDVLPPAAPGPITLERAIGMLPGATPSALGAAVLGAAEALFPRTAAPGSELPATAKPGEELPVTVPPPEVPVAPVQHEVTFGEGLGAGVKVGLDLASGPDVSAVVPAPRVPSQLGYTEAELAEIDRELAAEDAQRRAAPVAAEDLEKGDLVALVDGKLVKAAPPAPSTSADRDQAEHIEDVVGGAPEAPSAPAVS